MRTTTEAIIPKIINSTFISIDGIINHMDAWHFDYVDDQTDRITTEQLAGSAAMLMGRKTYEIYASAWPQREGRYPDMINSVPKYVVSSTLDKADWSNTTVLKGDLVAEAGRLRRESAGDILMHGFGPVAKTLIAHGLLDLLHLWVHPHFAGVGSTDDMLFGEGNNTRLDLVGTQVLKSGLVMLSYRPANATDA